MAPISCAAVFTMRHVAVVGQESGAPGSGVSAGSRVFPHPFCIFFSVGELSLGLWSTLMILLNKVRKRSHLVVRRRNRMCYPVQQWRSQHLLVALQARSDHKMALG